MTRGIRNNNPGNIRRTLDFWAGMARVQTDTEFVVFTSPEYGIRALAKLLKNYRLNTIKEIIERYAPPSENDTGSYVRSVCMAMNVGPVTPIKVTHPATMLALVKAIIHHENGQQPYTEEQLVEGLKLAGIT